MTKSRPRAASIRAASALVSLSDVQLVRQGLATIDEAMEYLCCGRTTVYRYFAEGLPYAVTGGKRRIPWTALYAFAAAGMVRRDRAVVAYREP